MQNTDHPIYIFNPEHDLCIANGDENFVPPRSAVGVKQKLMKGAITVSGLLTDVFNTAKWEVSSHNNIFDLTNISHNKSRMLWLGVSYNFNSFKQKSSQKNEADRALTRLGL